MSLTLLPRPDRTSLLRLSLLLLILVMVVGSTYEILKSDPGSAFLTASERLLFGRASELVGRLPNLAQTAPPRDPKYPESLLEQTQLITLCDAFVKRTGKRPKSLADLRSHISSAMPMTDPWRRAFILRDTESDLCVIQSTGPSGDDRLQSLSRQDIERFPRLSHFYVGDNLVVVGRLTR